MARAGELVRPGPDAERRVLQLINPELSTRSATHTISAAVQMVLPGEVAPAHRHTPAAIRFVIEGKGAVTFVDGSPCSMTPGDLILTPGWSWHGHMNQTEGPMIWMDSLDGPFVRSLRAVLHEPYPDELHPATRPVDHSINRYGGGHLRPIWEDTPSPISPLLSFPWAQTERSLRELAEVDASPYDDVAFRYTNPSTGGDVLPTIGCWVQMLRPSIHTQAHRHSTAAIYHVFRGRGSTVIDGLELKWEQGDFFAIPPWAWHEHRNASPSEEAILFSTNDIPVFRSVNLYREDRYEPHAGHQEMTGTYEERFG
jgi:gentisate 1,2-dioxygenase